MNKLKRIYTTAPHGKNLMMAGVVLSVVVNILTYTPFESVLPIYSWLLPVIPLVIGYMAVGNFTNEPVMSKLRIAFKSNLAFLIPYVLISIAVNAIAALIRSGFASFAELGASEMLLALLSLALGAGIGAIVLLLIFAIFGSIGALVRMK